MDDINGKVREIRMRWHGHVVRMEEANPVKKVMNMEIEGTRPRGRPRKRWKDNVRGHGSLPSESKGYRRRASMDGDDEGSRPCRLVGNQVSGREREREGTDGRGDLVKPLHN